MQYSAVVVGGGPAGMTLAWKLAQRSGPGGKILLIDLNSALGGCHRVHRVDGLFSEHGPRIYMGNYVNFRALLGEMGTNWDQHFVPYNFQLSSLGGESLGHFNLREMAILTWEYGRFVVNKTRAKEQTIGALMAAYSFRPSTRDYVDRLCRLSDGAGADRYTVFEFFQLVNQGAISRIYQPRYPNDAQPGGFVAHWEAALRATGRVDIWTDSRVIRLTPSHLVVDRTGYGHVNVSLRTETPLYLAIPPKALVSLLDSSPETRNAFGPFPALREWEQMTRYLPYQPIAFHWDTDLALPPVMGFPKTAWGVAFIVLSDYMKFSNPASKTVISTSITIPPPGLATMTQQQIISGVLEQLRESFPNLPEPTATIVDEDRDSAFVLTPAGYGPVRSTQYPNWVSVGTHNGFSDYAFTSLESAVANALTILGEPVAVAYTLNQILLMVFAVIMFFILYLKYNNGLN